MENNHKVLLIVGAGALVVILFLFSRRSSGSAPTVITSGSNTDLQPEQSRIQLAGINAGMFSKILDYASGQTTTASAERLGSQRLNSAEKIALAQNAGNREVAGLQAGTENARLAVQRELGLAQVEASKVIAQSAGANAALQAQQQAVNYLQGLRAQQEMANAQNRANAARVMLSQLGKILSALKPQSSGGMSSGGSGGTPPFVSPQKSTASPIVARNSARSVIQRFLANALGQNNPLQTDLIYNPNIDMYEPATYDYVATNPDNVFDVFNYADETGLEGWLMTPDTSSSIFELGPYTDPNYDPGASDEENFNDYGWALES